MHWLCICMHCTIHCCIQAKRFIVEYKLNNSLYALISCQCEYTDVLSSGFLKGSPGFGIPGQAGPKGESGERVSVYEACWPVFTSNCRTQQIQLKKYPHINCINHICDPGPQNQFLSRWGIFVEIAKNTSYRSKWSIFFLCQKSLRY